MFIILLMFFLMTLNGLQKTLQTFKNLLITPNYFIHESFDFSEDLYIETKSFLM